MRMREKMVNLMYFCNSDSKSYRWCCSATLGFRGLGLRVSRLQASCLDIFQITNGSAPDGVYTVQVRDLDDNVQDSRLFCDMTNGGSLEEGNRFK